MIAWCSGMGGLSSNNRQSPAPRAATAHLLKVMLDGVVLFALAARQILLGIGVFRHERWLRLAFRSQQGRRRVRLRDRVGSMCLTLQLQLCEFQGLGCCFEARQYKIVMP